MVASEPVPSPPRPEGSRAGPATGILPLRELTGWEEEYLTRHQHDANTARTCNDVLARCCARPGAEPDEGVRARVRDLLVAERDLELVRLRRMSIGPLVEARVECPACGAVNDAGFSLDDLDLDPGLPVERTGLPVGDNELTLTLPTAGDQEELLDADLDDLAERRTWLLARSLRRPDGSPLGLDAARELPLRRRAELERFVDLLLPTLDLTMEVSCADCGADFTAPFDVGSFFFELTGKAGGLLRDVHRIATTYHWSESQVWDLPLSRRLAYLLELEADADAALFAGLGTAADLERLS